MPQLIAYNPDGSRQTSGPGAAEPGGFVRSTERRALMSCVKSWWTRKAVPRPPPVGAYITVDGEKAFVCERIPIIVDDEVVDTRLDWVDIRVRAREEAEAAALAEAKAEHAKVKRTTKRGDK